MTKEEVARMFNNTLSAAQYCKEEKRELWTNLVSNAIATEQNEDVCDVELDILIDTANIMRYLDAGATWDDIKKVVAGKYSGYSFPALAQRMLQFSPLGIEYAQNVVGLHIVNSMDGLKQAYLKAVIEQSRLRGSAKQ